MLLTAVVLLSILPCGFSQASGAGAAPPPSTAGDASTPIVKAYVFCVKEISGVPQSSYLVTDNGQSVEIEGRWIEYPCQSAIITAFTQTKAQYDDLNVKCKAQGFEHAQPSDDSHPATYPFSVGGMFTEYYKQRTPFTFNHSPPTPIDRCGSGGKAPM